MGKDGKITKLPDENRQQRHQKGKRKDKKNL